MTDFATSTALVFKAMFIGVLSFFKPYLVGVVITLYMTTKIERGNHSLIGWIFAWVGANIIQIITSMTLIIHITNAVSTEFQVGLTHIFLLQTTVAVFALKFIDEAIYSSPKIARSIFQGIESLALRTGDIIEKLIENYLGKRKSDR